jgi:hypothetical protein
MGGVHEGIFGRESTYLIGEDSGSRKVLMEIDVENIVDEASGRYTVVAYI